MQKVISLPQHDVVLAPANMCVGMKFAGLKFKQVSFRRTHYIMVEHSDLALRRLSACGVVVPSRILRDYHWPSKYPTPFNHQKVTADFMVRNPRAFVFNDIGTAKSLTALWAADYMMTRGDMGRVLIASTLSTLERVWESEIFTHLMHRTCQVLHGSAEARKAKLALDADFYIVNHEGLKVLQNELELRSDITHVIVDEGARMRNQTTQLWKATNAVCGPKSGRSVWWMTGSPMPKAPTDAWAQARIVNPGTVPAYFSRFRDQTMYKATTFKWLPKKGWEEIVYSSLKPAIRFRRDECIDLPPRIVIDHPIKMTSEQKVAYEDLKNTLAAEFASGVVTAVNQAVMLGKLLQISGGAVYDSARDVHYIDVRPKLDELESILDETGDKLIIFVGYKHATKVITNWLDKHRSTDTYGVINGDVSNKARGEIFHAFQHGSMNIIVAHPMAMAHGLTLTASNTILWWSPIDNYEIYEQANGRITRPGQNRHQYIKHLVCTPIESTIYERLKTKESLQGVLLDMIRK